MNLSEFWHLRCQAGRFVGRTVIRDQRLWLDTDVLVNGDHKAGAYRLVHRSQNLRKWAINAIALYGKRQTLESTKPSEAQAVSAPFSPLCPASHR